MAEDNYSRSADERRVIRGLMALVIVFVLVMTIIVLWITSSLIRNRLGGSDQIDPTSPPPSETSVSPSASPTATLEATSTPTVTLTPTLILLDSPSTPVPKAEYVRFLYWYVKPNRVKVGECVQITWETEYAVSLNLYRNGELILENAPPSATLQECPDQPGYTVYRMVAENSDGVSNWIQLQVKVDEAP